MAEYQSTTHPWKRKKNGKKCSCCVHIKVWIEQNGEVPNGMIVHHKNGDKHDNRIDNLEMVNRSQHSLLHPRDNINDVMKFVRSKR